MMPRSALWSSTAAIICALTTGCATQPPEVAMSSKGDVVMRAMETRVYPVQDKGQALRAVIATLQDLGYNVDRVRGVTGTATAFKQSVLRVSVAVSPHGPGQMAVRANAEVQVGLQFHQVDEPVFYETDFFELLSHALALQAAQTDGTEPVPLPDSIYSTAKS